MAATGTPAACSKLTLAGFATTAPFAGIETYSAKAQRSLPPNTSSPGLNSVTLFPTDSTVPAKSVPSTTGFALKPPLSRRAVYATRDSGKKSTGLTEAAWTRTSTPSSAIDGLSMSSSSRTSGRPGRRQRIAFMPPARSAELERRIFIGDQEKGVGGDPVAPADHTNDVAEEVLRIPAREDDREPGDDHRDHGADSEEEQDDVMGDGEEPLHQRQPAVQLAGIGIVEV